MQRVRKHAICTFLVAWSATDFISYFIFNLPIYIHVRWATLSCVSLPFLWESSPTMLLLVPLLCRFQLLLNTGWMNYIPSHHRFQSHCRVSETSITVPL